tara:strand:+ start:746 stop:1858 length:1113 start_codon:yes stop_codon:yes gene_type:complete
MTTNMPFETNLVLDFSAELLSAIPLPVLIADGSDEIVYANPAAENFFQLSIAGLTNRNLQDLIPQDSPLMSLAHKVRRAGNSMQEFSIRLATPRIGDKMVSVTAATLGSHTSFVAIVLNEITVAERIDTSLVHRDVARSVTAMSAVLAHEIKNPLSGVRGAAQLLEQSAPSNERPLARLIIDESDRICRLIDRIEAFSDRPRIEKYAVNLHEVLDHVIHIANTGFAKGIPIVKAYDPSLPKVFGDRDHLIQVFLNLAKNAAEALDGVHEPAIRVHTAFQYGMRLATPGLHSRVDLPLIVSIEDNGGGIPDEMVRQIFDPFVSTKAQNAGLGLALVAKLIDDHGGMIDVLNGPDKTTFKVMMPMARSDNRE